MPEPLIVIHVVDIKEDAFIFYLKLEKFVGMVRKDGPAACISLERQDLAEEGPVQQDWIAADSVVGRNHDPGGGMAIRIDDAVERSGLNKGLIAQDDQRGAGNRARRGNSGAQ